MSNKLRKGMLVTITNPFGGKFHSKIELIANLGTWIYVRGSYISWHLDQVKRKRKNASKKIKQL